VRQLTRCDPPPELRTNSSLWTNELLNAIRLTPDRIYLQLSQSQKNRLVRSYFKKFPIIKNTLFRFSGEKCAYCETIPTTGRIQRTIDHFEPVSIHPDSTFQWENLLPSCHDCNSNKRTLDTRVSPIVNPCNDNPEEYFTFNILLLEPSNNLTHEEFTKANRTIIELNLNSEYLLKSRGTLAAAFQAPIAKLRRTMNYLDNNIGHIDQNWESRFVKFRNLLDGLSEEINPALPFLTYRELIINNNTVYQEALRKRVDYENIIRGLVI